MAEPLLSSLCRICHTNPPKYRCPRCSSQTCSLTCSKRHKLWSDCNGIRDPTIYKPIHEVATPAGIDHDYNFISKIERGIERSDRMIVEEKGLVDRKELTGYGDNRQWKGRHHAGGDTLLDKALQRAGVIVDKAPKGMRRNTDNGTNWSKYQKCINWQIEWIRNDGSHAMSKGLEVNLIAEIYTTFVEDQRRAAMTPAEKKQDKKRKAAELQRAVKKAKLDPPLNIMMQSFSLQNPGSSAWNRIVNPTSEEANINTEPDADLVPEPHLDSPKTSAMYHFYLHRPHTPSSLPRVLIPLSSSEPLSAALRNRIVLEFPTIYALLSPPTSLSDDFMLEDTYLRQHFEPSGHNGVDTEDVEMDEGEIDES